MTLDYRTLAVECVCLFIYDRWYKMGKMISYLSVCVGTFRAYQAFRTHSSVQSTEDSAESGSVSARSQTMIVYLLIWLVISALLVFLLWHPQIWRQIYLASRLPGPLALPIIGNSYLFANAKSTQLFKVFYDLAPVYGNVVRVWIFERLFVVIAGADEAEVMPNDDTIIYEPSV